MLWTPEERWDRLAKGLMWTAVLFGVFAAYGIYDGDDWRGVVMTIVPGAVIGLFAYIAAARRDHVIDGTPSSWFERIATITGIAILGTLAALWFLEAGEHADRAEQREIDRLTHPIQWQGQTVECERETMINGQKVMLKSLCRR